MSSNPFEHPFDSPLAARGLSESQVRLVADALETAVCPSETGAIEVTLVWSAGADQPKAVVVRVSWIALASALVAASKELATNGLTLVAAAEAALAALGAVVGSSLTLTTDEALVVGEAVLATNGGSTFRTRAVEAALADYERRVPGAPRVDRVRDVLNRLAGLRVVEELDPDEWRFVERAEVWGHWPVGR